MIGLARRLRPLRSGGVLAIGAASDALLARRLRSGSALAIGVLAIGAA
jgi:hypothetical protein